MREKRHQIFWPKRFLSSAANNGLPPGVSIVSGSHTGESRELMTSHLNTILLWYTTALWVFRFCPRPKTPTDNAAFRPFKLVGYLQIKYWKSHRGLAPSHPIRQVNRSPINWDSWEPLGNIWGVSGLDVWLALSGTILCFENVNIRMLPMRSGALGFRVQLEAACEGWGAGPPRHSLHQPASAPKPLSVTAACQQVRKTPLWDTYGKTGLLKQPLVMWTWISKWRMIRSQKFGRKVQKNS